jgi:4-hydroxy-3-methylbut-2-enyl diphosphate reductase
LRPEWAKGARVVGITAGASAPETLVEDVINALAQFDRVDISTMTGRIEDIEFKLPVSLSIPDRPSWRPASA